MRNPIRLGGIVLLWLAAFGLSAVTTAPQQETTAIGAGRQRVLIRSTRDGSLQPSYITVPANYDARGPAVPMLISLHTWSFGLEQRLQAFETEAARRNWIYLFPDFRGVDDHPEACASDLAQQDVVDAAAWARAHLNVDARRIYLYGWSGGGHMALMMAARAPELWAAASVWAPITDLAVWYRERAADPFPQVERQIRACVGGVPGESAAVDAQYRARSPVTVVGKAAAVPIDLWAGRHDGHAPPGDDVAVHHVLDAFNEIAKANRAPLVSPAEIDQLRPTDGRLAQPRPEDIAPDPVLGREVFLRRTAGPSRVTIYEGHHESLPAPAFAWFESHTKR